MPDHLEFQNNAGSSSSNASPDNLEEAIWRLKVEDDDQEGLDGHPNPHPDRPGVPDCIYYLRTGLCGYGNNCRYNHPSYDAQGPQERDELPQRVGQPDCQYFLKTGTCKFGVTCKYHHPRDKHVARPAPLSNLGLPMRQDEKSCPFYMRTGACKFGTACKFNHPPPAPLGAVFPVTGASAYGPTGSSVVPSSGFPLVGGLSPWPFPRYPYVPSPQMQGLPTFVPVMLPPSQGTLPVQQGWSTYTITNNAELHEQSGPSTRAYVPECPNQPECQYYMKNGSCMYGTNCRYQHPKERYSDDPSTLGPLGLPLRPGHTVCTFYSMYGSCRYGSACKYDHPLLGFYNYAVPSLSVPDPRNLPQATWAAAVETSVPKMLKLPEHFRRSGETNSSEAKMNSANNNNEHINISILPSNAAPSDSLNHSD